jgi:hypothetical protein
MSRALLRRRVRVLSGGGGEPPLTGDFSSAYRYVPRWTLPTGVTYNPATGLCEGLPMATSYTPSGNEVLLTDQGSATANRSLLQTTITNAGSDAVRIRLAPVTTHWGDELYAPNASRVGVGMSIEAAGVKDGSIGTGRVTTGTSGLAPFRFAKTHAWGSPPDGNADNRGVFHLQGANVRLVGLDLAYDATWAATLANLTGTPGAERGSAGGLIGWYSGSGSTYPDRMIVDRCRVQGAEQKPLLRAIYVNGTNIAVLNSWIDNVHYRGNDSQGFLSTDGAGPYVLDDNYMALAFGENWMIGGGQVSSVGTMPSNIVIRRNHFDFPARFASRGYQSKNLSEFKVGDTALYERNLLTGYIGDGYDGQFFALVLKNVAQNGAGADPFNRLRNVTVRLNEIRDCEQALSIAGDFEVDNGTEQIDVSHNRMSFTNYTVPGSIRRGWMTQVSMSGSTDARRQKRISIHHNTIGAPRCSNTFTRILQDTSANTETRVIGLKVQGNLMVYNESGALPEAPGGYYGRDGDGFNAQTSLNLITDKVDFAWGNNGIVGAVPGGALVTGDVSYATQSAAGLTGTDFRLGSGSPALTADSDGGAIGCNHALLDAGLAGVSA